ncbi:MAG TPA: glycosyl hydrolase family 28 protein [Phycisphaerae bacterium]|nr:glycosyl hydrolase family 28 protein [Phycisphaerae bacterium]
MKTFNVLDFGAAGDGTTLDTDALQKAIDSASAHAAAAGGVTKSRVLLPGKKKFLVGCLTLRSNIDFHLADDAQLLVSTTRTDYHETSHGSHGGDGPGVLTGDNLRNLSFSGTGIINGRSPDFMDHFDSVNEWWRPKSWRPRLLLLTGCQDLELQGITIKDAPSWTVHLLGCQRVLIDAITIANQLDVPNCDGIDPDHCQDVEIKNCHITCGDDGIVIKTTRQPPPAPGAPDYGPSENIRISDCTIRTQDSCLKIGTETVSDIRNIRFERCKLLDGCRGICIQLRDQGNISNIDFRDITFTARYFSDPWWGRGEGISFTAIPRTFGSPLGKLSNVRVANVTGRCENSARIDAAASGFISDILFDNVHLTLDRWTKYKGGVFDNRPTKALEDIEPHNTPAFFVRHAANVTLQNCRADWGNNIPDYFSYALEMQNSVGVRHPGFIGHAAHPDRDPAMMTKIVERVPLKIVLPT